MSNYAVYTILGVCVLDRDLFIRGPAEVNCGHPIHPDWVCCPVCGKRAEWSKVEIDGFSECDGMFWAGATGYDVLRPMNYRYAYIGKILATILDEMSGLAEYQRFMPLSGPENVHLCILRH